MASYIDGFILPLPEKHLEEYKRVSKKVAEIWKEYGATDYKEFLGDDLFLQGTQSFIDLTNSKEKECIVFGWVSFPSKEIRDQANQKVPLDPRMEELVAPLTQPDRLIFNAERMVYGGFKPLW